MKKKMFAVFGILCVLAVAGCGLTPDNKKRTLDIRDPETGEVTATQTDYEFSNSGIHSQSIKDMVVGSKNDLDFQLAVLAERTKCVGCSMEAKAWADAALVIGVVSMTNSSNQKIVEVVRLMPAPKTWQDVWNNVIDKNTIPLLGAMGVTGWVTEALSGAGLGTTNNVNTNGGDISDAFNRTETHFTGSTVDNGASIEIPFLSPTTNTTTNTN